MTRFATVSRLALRRLRNRYAAALRARRTLFEQLEDRAVLAATLTWVGDVDSNWATNSGGNTNWSGNSLPADGDTLVFDISGSNLTQVNNTTAGNSYTLQYSSGGYVLTGNSIALNNSGDDIVSSSGTNQLNLPLALAPGSTFNIGAGIVTVGGTISGSGDLVKVGAGRLTLSGTNTYSGSTTISGGILSANTSAALGNETSTNTLILNGGTLLATGNIVSPAARGVMLNGSSTSTIDANALAITIDGIISGGTTGVDSLTLISTSTSATPGSVTLTGNNTYFGNTITNKPSINLRHSNALGASGAGNATTVKSGAAGSIGTALNLNPQSTAIDVPESLHLSGLSANRVALQNLTLNNTFSGPIDITSTGSVAQIYSEGSGSLTVTGDITGALTSTTFFIRGASTSLSNRLLGSVNFTGGNLSKTGAGTWFIGAAGKTYSWNNTVVASQVLRLGADNVLPPTGTLTLGEGSNLTTRLDLNGFNQTTTDVTISYASATSLVPTISTGTGTLTLNGNLSYNINTAYTGTGGLISGNLDLGGGTRTFNIGQATPAIDFTISAAISNGSLTKTGLGTLALTGTNTYEGTTTISAGTLSVTGSLSNSTDVSVALGATYNVGASDTIDGLFGSGNVILGTNSLTVGGNNEAMPSFGGGISGTGSVIKAGNGVQAFTGTNSYLGTTSVNAGTLQLQGGTTISDMAGTVTVQPGAELQLLTDETVSSFVGIDDPANEVDGLLALGANQLTTLGDATIANVTTASGGRLVAQGAIIDGDLDNNVTGPNIFLQAATGIGSGDAIETAVVDATLSSMTGSVAITELDALNLLGLSAFDGNATITAGGALTDDATAAISVSGSAAFSASSITLGEAAGNALNLGSLTFTATAGGTTIHENSALDLFGSSSATGSIVLTSLDTGATGENITLPLGAALTSSGGSVTLNAGDDALLDGDVNALTQVTVNVDAGDGESNGVGEVAPGSGGTVTINGVITVNGGAGTTFLNGGDDYDTFDFDPQTTTSFSVNGNAPHGTADGDRLVITVPALTVQTVSDVGSGGFSFAPTANPALDPVTYVSIEEQDVTGGPLNLLIDLTPVYNGVNNQLTMQRVGADLVINRLGTGPVTGNFYTGTLATINSLEIRGGGQNDSVEVFDTGTGLPDFVGTVPGVTNNPNVVGTPEFLFTGGAGTDVLTFNLGLASTAQVYGIGSGSGTAANDGEISTTNPANTLITYFTSVSEVNRAGFNATAGGLQILGDLSGNTINTTDNGGGETRVQPTGYTPFDFSGDNFSSFEVYGLRGSDTLTLTSFGSGQTNNPTIVLDGSNPTGFGGPTDDGLADTLRVLSTSSNTGLVTLLGGLGSDQFFLAGPGLTVDDIAGPVVVDGEDNNLAGNNDQLFIDDSGDTTADPNVLIAAAGGMNADYAVTGINASGVTFRNIDSFDYTGTQGGDTIDGRFTPTNVPHDLNTVALRGFDGDDQFLLFTSNQWGGVTPVTELPFTRVASGVGTISLYGNDGEDIFGETPAPVIGNTGAMHVGLAVPATTRLIRPTTAATAGGSTIFIDGGDPVPALNQAGDTVGDVLNLDVTDVPKNTAMIVGAGSSGNVLSANTAPFSWVSIEDLNLVDNGKLTGVQIGDVFGRGTTGNDLMQISANATAALPHQVRVRIGGAIMNYNVPGKAVLYGGNGVDTMSQTTAKIPAVFYGEAGNDSLAGGSNNDWLVGGDGNDQITGGEGQNVIWGDNAPTNPGDPTPQDFQGPNDGNDSISSGNGADVIYAGGGHDVVNSGGGNDYIHAGAGNDSVDAGAGDDRVYGYSGNDTLQGNSGNDLLSGGDGNDWLLGHSGNNVLIGGTGSDTLSGGDGNDLLITGGLGGEENSTWTSAPNTMTYAANTYSDPMDNDAALLALLTAWQGNSNAAAPPPEVLALLPIIAPDGSDDDAWGGNGSDLFSWDAADMADESLTAPGPNDFNNPATGPDVRLI
ncbi:Hemolysin, chromosomal [Anatilimnocola aggregata]|uniref:Hemolysin, chromosomal n=1 Tax=Anatilimnocola aggregata TaxID=2528021 RepID=A0A517YCL6_9BACT|nr:calcium-binding protein [Anatilimnocola aggregata]QDU27939.1 Hemolysin, chromosomal [Anatilimnocola aggregata]